MARKKKSKKKSRKSRKIHDADWLDGRILRDLQVVASINVVPLKHEEDIQAFLRRVVGVMSTSFDVLDRWDHLSPEAQAWFNEAAEAIKADQPIPLPVDPPSPFPLPAGEPLYLSEKMQEMLIGLSESHRIIMLMLLRGESLDEAGYQAGSQCDENPAAQAYCFLRTHPDFAVQIPKEWQRQMMMRAKASSPTSRSRCSPRITEATGFTGVGHDRLYTNGRTLADMEASLKRMADPQPKEGTVAAEVLRLFKGQDVTAKQIAAKLKNPLRSISSFLSRMSRQTKFGITRVKLGVYHIGG